MSMTAGGMSDEGERVVNKAVQPSVFTQQTALYEASVICVPYRGVITMHGDISEGNLYAMLTVVWSNCIIT